jgi:hypothetical protein
MSKREKISLTLRLEFNSVSVTDLSKTPRNQGAGWCSGTGIGNGSIVMDIESLLDLRKLTQAVSRHYASRLRAHLATLAPLFSPLPLLGEYARGGSKSSGSSAEKAYRELCARFQAVAEQPPYDLSLELKPPLDLFAATPVLTPMERAYTIQVEEADHRISITSPLKWTLSYPETEPKRLKELMAQDRTQAKEALAHALLQSIALTILLEQRPGLVRLFEDLRCPLQTLHREELGELPVTAISAPVGSRLPDDDIILQNCLLSGVPSFEEIVDLDHLRNLSDPVRQECLTFAQSLTPAIYRKIID